MSRELHPQDLSSIDEIRVLAHPLRLRLYYALASAGPATAAVLAQSLDAPPALVSYHLRELGKYGLALETEAEDQDRRKRWWKVKEGGVSVSVDAFRGDPRGRRATRTLYQLALARQVELWESFENRAAEWGDQWTSASFSSDRSARLTPVQLKAMHQELEDVLTKWCNLPRSEDSGPTPATVNVFIHGFPVSP